MNVIDTISSRIRDRGMTITTVARRSEMSVDLLSKSLRGKRRLKAEELVAKCMVLGLTVDDFESNALEEKQRVDLMQGVCS